MIASLVVGWAQILGLVSGQAGEGSKVVGRPPDFPPVVRVSPPEAMGAVEVSVGINPTNPNHLIASSIARLRQHPGISDFSYVSLDGGKTWKTYPRVNPRGVQQGDDVITFTPDGVAVHAFISFVGIRQARPKRAYSAIITCTSKDGITWSDQVPVVEHVNTVEPHEDKPWITADHSPQSPHKGNLYIAWSRFDVYGSDKPEHKTQVYVSRSTDKGKSFAVPLKISDVPGDARDKSNSLMGACPAVGPKGEVHVVWAGPESLFYTRSVDGGLQFEKPRPVIRGVSWDFPIKGLGRANGLPSIGVDVSPGKHQGTVSLCWADERNGDSDIFLAQSKNGGIDWGQPRRLGKDKPGNGREQWFPWMVIDPVDGSINIAYYDRSQREGTLTDIVLARSVDGGETFAYFPLNETPYDLSQLGFFGDYLGIDCRGGRVAVLWMNPFPVTQGERQTKPLGISSVVLDFEPGKNQLKAGTGR